MGGVGDADPLDAELAKLGMEMISPHRRNRKNPGRKTAGRYVGIAAAGRSSGYSRGWATSAARLPSMNSTPSTTSDFVQLGRILTLLRHA